MCRLPAPIVAGRGRASPDICRRWLPAWLPAISLASLTFERPNGVPNQASGWLASRSNRAVWCDNRGVQVVVRRARSDDQPVITAMVRRARLNPAGLHWEQFVVGERDGRAVGVAQLRRHSDGTKELASLVVEPGAREHGIATQMVDALLADETAAVYALIDRRFVGHFARWGFRQVGRNELPRPVSRTYLIGRVVTTLGSLLRRQRIRIVPLLRPAR
jgi:amino-acid N-acetyltransferase